MEWKLVLLLQVNKQHHSELSKEDKNKTSGKYKALREECMPLVAEIPLETCQEWHAVIDVHGKAYRKGFTDEQWLIE